MSKRGLSLSIDSNVCLSKHLPRRGNARERILWTRIPYRETYFIVFVLSYARSYFHYLLTLEFNWMRLV